MAAGYEYKISKTDAFSFQRAAPNVFPPFLHSRLFSFCSAHRTGASAFVYSLSLSLSLTHTHTYYTHTHTYSAQRIASSRKLSLLKQTTHARTHTHTRAHTHTPFRDEHCVVRIILDGFQKRSRTHRTLTKIACQQLVKHVSRCQQLVKSDAPNPNQNQMSAAGKACQQMSAESVWLPLFVVHTSVFTTCWHLLTCFTSCRHKKIASTICPKAGSPYSLTNTF